MADILHPAVPQFNLYQSRHYTPTPGFINHTPRDFEIKAAHAVITSHPAMATMTLSKGAVAHGARFDLPSSQSPTSRMGTLRTVKEEGKRQPHTPAPTRSHRSTAMQPRDATGSPGDTAMDLAYFLRDNPPPHCDLDDLQASVKPTSSQRLKRVLKFRNNRIVAPSLAYRSSEDSERTKHVVEKVSADGARYLQIVFDQLHDLDLPVHELMDVERTVDMSYDSCHCYAHSSRPSTPLLERERSETDTEDAGSESNHECKPIDACQTGNVEHDSDFSEIYQAYSQLSPNHLAYNQAKPLITGNDTPKEVDSAHSSPVTRFEQKQMSDFAIPLSYSLVAAPLTIPPLRPLPPVPESRPISLQPLPWNATKIACQNGHPVLLDKMGHEHTSNQGLRRISREQDAVGFSTSSSLPSPIPERKQSQNAQSGTKHISSANPASDRMVLAGSTQTDRDMDAAKRGNNLAGAKSSAIRTQRAEKTRARKLRDLERSRGNIDAVLEQSLQDWTTGESQQHSAPHAVSELQINSQTYEPDFIRTHTHEDSGNVVISPVVRQISSASLPGSDRESRSSGPETPRRASKPPSITVNGGLPFPLPPRYTPVATPSGEISPLDVHPAFRNQSPGSASPIRQSYLDRQPSSLPALSRSVTPVINRPLRGATRSSSDPKLESRIETLERENRLLEAALKAVLQTAGSINGCPCGGRHSSDSTTRSTDENKRESGASTGTTTTADSNELSALELYIRTREDLAARAGYRSFGRADCYGPQLRRE